MEPTNAEVAEVQLTALATTLATRLDTFLASPDETLPDLIARNARYVIETLTQPTYGQVATYAAQESAMRVLALVNPVSDPSWWSTALGQLVAWHVGFGAEAVPRVHAAAILGITRQRVSQLLNAGILLLVDDGGDDDTPLRSVSNKSVLARLHAATLRG